jgi:predicted metal-dependent hydrolase
MYNYTMKSRQRVQLPANVEVIRSNRKSFSLEVKLDGSLLVRAPKRASDVDIQAVLTQKAPWIEGTQAKIKRKFPDYQPKKFKPGEKFWYLGHQYPLKLTDRQRPSLMLDGSFLLAHPAKDRAREVFIAWYREQTRQITADLIQQYTTAYSFDVNQVRITSARTRWGSCSGKNNLNFTYRLSMAPLPIIDYVVVHELVHLKVRNHSPAFWNALAAIMPDYKEKRDWLKRHGALLSLDL